ncbi:SDR family oxidoreductase [Dehalococcoidia bacterium]|nr:SDR family oxidoreductase [Dehalococcoidia bacterium]
MDRSLTSLEGRTAIVTGSAQGIGKGMALGLAAFGSNVVVADINGGMAEATAAELEGNGVKALPFKVNVRRADEVTGMVNAVMQQFGRIDTLINNVGGTFDADFMDVNERGADALIEINLKSVFHCTKAVVGEMIKAGQGGSIITVTTLHTFYSAPGHAIYSACKAGVDNFVNSLAVELAPHRIRVNSIVPGLVETPGVSYEDRDETVQRVPMGRIGTTDEMAGAAVFLASDMSTYVSGAHILVDGALTAAGGAH